MEQKKIETKRILLYLAITFLITFGYEMLFIWPLAKGTTLEASQTLQLAISVVMFFPALGVLLTRLITKEGFRDAKLHVHLKGHVCYYLMAWFGTSILCLLGAVVYYLVYTGRFDISMHDMIEQQLAVYAKAGIDGVTEDQIRTQQFISLVAAIFLGPALNVITCFGEEWGWRGYLLPKMKEKMSMPLVLLTCGVIWGLWHAPLTAIGHNYGTGYWGFPFTGILAMCFFSTVVGVIFSFLSIKTDSVWPAVIGHGAINSFGSAGLLFHKGEVNMFIGPAPTGILGGCAFIIAAIIMGWMLIKERSDKA